MFSNDFELSNFGLYFFILPKKNSMAIWSNLALPKKSKKVLSKSFSRTIKSTNSKRGIFVEETVTLQVLSFVFFLEDVS